MKGDPPRTAIAQQNCEAWWYANPGQGHIDIFVHQLPDGPTQHVSIKKRSLRAFAVERRLVEGGK